jgi:hypothetical protein
MRSNKLATIAVSLCLVGGFGAATAFAQNGDGQSTSTTTTTSCQNNQQGVDEQGTASDVNAAADDVLQEADSQQADDQSGDQQGPNDNNEQGDVQNCEDGGDNGGD